MDGLGLFASTNVTEEHYTNYQSEYNTYKTDKHYDQREFSYNPTSVFSPTAVFESPKAPDMAQDISALKQLQTDEENRVTYQMKSAALPLVAQPMTSGGPVSIMLIIAALVLAMIVIFKRR